MNYKKYHTLFEKVERGQTAKTIYLLQLLQEKNALYDWVDTYKKLETGDNSHNGGFRRKHTWENWGSSLRETPWKLGKKA